MKSCASIRPKEDKQQQPACRRGSRLGGAPYQPCLADSIPRRALTLLKRKTARVATFKDTSTIRGWSNPIRRPRNTGVAVSDERSLERRQRSSFVSAGVAATDPFLGIFIEPS